MNEGLLGKPLEEFLVLGGPAKHHAGHTAAICVHDGMEARCHEEVAAREYVLVLEAVKLIFEE